MGVPLSLPLLLLFLAPLAQGLILPKLCPGAAAGRVGSNAPSPRPLVTRGECAELDRPRQVAAGSGLRLAKRDRKVNLQVTLCPAATLLLFNPDSSPRKKAILSPCHRCRE